MTESRPEQLVVVGDGVAGVMTAAALARALPQQRYAVHLVPAGRTDDSLGFARPAETARPSLRRFHQRLGVDEEQLVRSAGASYALGTAWSGWSASRPSYFLPFGGAGAALEGVPFHQLVARLRAAGRSVKPGDFAPAALMAQTGRFAPPPADPRHPLSDVAYALHLPAEGYRALLLQQARALGVRHCRASFQAVELSAEHMIEAVVLEDGTKLTGLLFVDASGPRAVLANALPGERFLSWQRWLPCDRALVAERVTSVPPAPYAHCEAHSGGWRLQVPVQQRVGETLVYASGFVTDADGGRLLADARTAAAFEQGRRAEPWSGNCVAIGAAAAVLEPQHGLDLHLVQTAIERLLKLLPHALPATAEQREYNRQTAEELDRARDLIIASYALNGRVGEPFYDALRSAELPVELATKLDLYRSRGRVPLLDGDLLEEPEWALLLDELGLRARRYDALADAIPIERLEEQLGRMRQAWFAAIRMLPLHGDYLAQVQQRAAA